MKKRYVVKYSFTADFEAESDSHALGDAALSIRYGIEKARNMELKVVAAIPLATQAETQAPPPVEVAVEANIPPAPSKNDLPF